MPWVIALTAWIAPKKAAYFARLISPVTGLGM